MGITLGTSIFITPKYKATSKLIVVFNQGNIDAYTASKNSSYITSILAEVVYSNSFIGDVLTNNYNLKDNLGMTNEARQKSWKKMIKISTLDAQGIIIVDSYNNDKYQAYQFAQSVSAVLMSSHGQYDGFGDKVIIKQIDNSSLSDNWYPLQIIKNTILGFLAGLFLGITFIVIFPQQQIFKIFSFNLDRIRENETIGLEQYNYNSNIQPYSADWMNYNQSQPKEQDQESNRDS
jgi:capsular polysaccharide biosynthesis protein